MNSEQRHYRFLDPPDDAVRNRWQYPELEPVKYDLDHEARCSTLIERETAWQPNRAALDTGGQGAELLLAAHQRLFQGDSRFRAGRWRQHNVTVGRFVPPHWELVPRLMEHFDAFIRDEHVRLVLRAVWGHIQFETIHPFPDGNGRIGRLMVNKLLDRPWSHAVLTEHRNYYGILSAPDWGTWSEWMTRTLRECPTHPDRVPPPPIFEGETWSVAHTRIYDAVRGVGPDAASTKG